MANQRCEGHLDCACHPTKERGIPSDFGCKICGHPTSVNGAPATVVAVVNGEDVYACDVHQRELAAPAGDPLVAIAQLQDMARRRLCTWSS